MVRLITTPNFRERTIILPDNYPQFAFDSLKLLDVTKIKSISSNYKYKISEIFIPPNPNSGFYNKRKLLRLKKYLFSALSISDSTFSTKKIYITRKSASRRKVENEDNLINFLKEQNFEILDTATISFEEQVKIFSQCKILISIHGAGLTNCLFMPPHSQVIEFYKANTFINYCYERLCAQLDIRYNRVFCQGGKNKDTHVDKTDLIVNIDDLKGLI